ncbi:MAG: valine--tRNA ligase [Clostridia bacterium]|nr:valine--tRNA ligase [Clostridia bacterium]
MKELEKVYNPQEFEDRIYDFWLKGRYFHSEPDENKQPFTIVIPPPNVTGQLHMGHALDETLQDILIRYKRMQGFNALWIPGTDHAGIATQIKVEEVLRKEEGLTRYDLGREKFLERVWDWKKMYGDRIINQLKKLGSSCDWERERFTMDEGCSKAVKEVFVNLYEKGLIYKGNRIINWCPNCTTALSDAEVVYEEQPGHFWHIRYPVKDSDEYVTIATTRPETLLGDSAVAVHPEDERYTHLVGKMLILPLVGREIPVVADEYVDKEFGTGCVKITPCHDPNDFEVGKRHNLEEILIMDGNAKINANGGKYEGMDRYEARKQIVKDLEEGGYLVKIEDHTHNVGACYRCGCTVEPMASSQWFVKMQPLAEKSIKEVKAGETQFVPERFSKTYLNWMENVHDWCISRQLWWGHRIPAYYCDACGEMVISKEDVHTCPKCGAPMRQEEDVLDTWFSSALWPFSTLGWPEKTPELDYYYPTSTLVTGYDIIFFWVARMIFSGLEQMGEVPFKHVLIHGLVRDSQGRKMSKSLGNGIDPLEVIKEFGADALRFTLATGNAPGNDMRYYPERVEASRNFANKVWNAARFILMNLKEEDLSFSTENLKPEDEWILTRYNEVVRDVTENLDKFEIGLALQKVYDFIWDLFCDWYIELVKPRLYAGGEESASAQKVLLYVFSGALKMLHPFMPFITEEIWQALPVEDEAIMIARFPVYDSRLCFKEGAEKMEHIMETIKAIRDRRAEMNVPLSKKASLYIETVHTEWFEGAESFYQKLAGADQVYLNTPAPEGTVKLVCNGASLYIPFAELVDIKGEIARLEKELEKAKGELARVEGKLSNQGFMAKAPAALVAAETAKKEKFLALIADLTKSIEEMKSKL